MENKILHITKILQSECIKVYEGSRGGVKQLQWSLPSNNELETFNRLFNYCNLNDLIGEIRLEIQYNQPNLYFIIEL